MRFEPDSRIKGLPTHGYMGFLDQLESVPSNSVLYKVYATSKPTKLGGKEHLIGTIQLHGKL